MGSKNISIRQDVYDHLKELRREDESFSDEIIRLIGEDKNDFTDIIGLEVDVEWADAKKGRKKDSERGIPAN